MKTLNLFALLVLQVALLGSGEAWGQGKEIFQIGKKDDSYAEFARERKAGQAVVYEEGKSSAAKDWYAYQPGTFDYEVGYNTREKDWVNYRPGSSGRLAKDPVPVPFEVKFSLASAPRGRFVLHLDAIFRYGRPAAPRYAVDINGHAGSYRLVPRPAPQLWWPTGGGGIQFIGYESLDMPLPASYFQRGENTLTVRCEGGYGIYYDDLSLRNEAGSGVRRVLSASVKPTIFYKRQGSGLVELGEVELRTSRPLGQATVRVEIGATRVEEGINQSEFGDTEVTIEVPATDRPVPVAVYVGKGKTPVYRGSFVPQRRWRVYALPMEQADFGYDEVPARTLEWENQYLDKALEIEKQFPSYSFTLDASANLESYLATRDKAQGQALLDYLRNGKFGINALYENFFTGLCTPEELFEMLHYALQAGERYGFPVDAASQTDEPTVTWALPEVLAAGGIKYFAEGSDPIRAPFNPIGHMNFHSPFYWQAPNGAKVLMWSAVSYTVVEDMTWGGWNPESVKAGQYHPSTFGLKHSLPLFLSQYDRKGYPFDAVFLYGLHNDEVPIRHNGSADVIKEWNEKYAYPKVIPATQRDFFSYVTEHFGSQIKTYRGDAGAYWEDEAGSDAKIAALNRTSQMQVTAAEKLGSIAQWLKPLLRFHVEPFQDAWKNIMLADDYVWSDSNSLRQPYSYLTHYEEDAHRGYAEAAYRQTRDLLRVAMDKVSQLVQANEPGVVVFNSESWVGNGFFDVELGPDQALQDPGSGKLLPCGVVKAREGYNEVRCWASGVPALGYKFYATAKGKVSAGEAVRMENAGAPIDGKYYRLQLDPETGAMVHLVDKATGQDLVNGGSGYRLNEYLYVSGGNPTAYYHGLTHGGNNDNRLLNADPMLPIAKLTVNKPTLVGTPTVQRFPWGTIVTIHARAMNTPQIVSRITLNDEEKVVSFDNELQKATTLKKEGVYFAFPFAVQKPVMEYQGATAWVNPETDMLPGANREWFTTQGGVRFQGTHQGIDWVSVDAPLITLEDINRGRWPATIKIQDGTVFSYAMNNYWYTDAPAQQGGHFRFRYALTSGSTVSMAASTRLTLEQRSPLSVIPYEHKEWKRTLPEQGAGFVSAGPEGVTILTIRPVEGGESDTYLMRVQNATGKATRAAIEFPRVHLEDAYLGSVLGKRAGSVEWSKHEVRIPMARFDVKTLVVRVKADQN